MLNNQITLLVNKDLISASLTLPPFFFHKNNNFLKIYTSLNNCLKKDTNKVIIILRGKKYTLRTLKKSEKKYNKVVYVHDNDNCNIDMEIYELVDLYIKKQKYINEEIYKKINSKLILFMVTFILARAIILEMI